MNILEDTLFMTFFSSEHCAVDSYCNEVVESVNCLYVAIFLGVSGNLWLLDQNSLLAFESLLDVCSLFSVVAVTNREIPLEDRKEV